MGEKNSTGVEYILLNAKRRKRHYFERVEIRTCHILKITTYNKNRTRDSDRGQTVS
jgi:hypothetical protein